MRHERYHTRDLAYSAWHRADSIRRYVGDAWANELTYIDIDGLEYCRACREPLCLIELARDVGQTDKTTRVLVKLGERADLPVVLALYSTNGGDITGFRVKRRRPDGERAWRHMSAGEFAAMLVELREGHTCYWGRAMPPRSALERSTASACD